MFPIIILTWTLLALDQQGILPPFTRKSAVLFFDLVFIRLQIIIMIIVLLHRLLILSAFFLKGHPQLYRNHAIPLFSITPLSLSFLYVSYFLKTMPVSSK